ncbi:hypothetical protein ACFL0K_02800 [Patescibacteria group bacterium]
MILRIEAVGEVRVPGMNQQSAAAIMGGVCSPHNALIESMFKSRISGHWFVSGNVMTRVDGAGDLLPAVDFILDMNKLDIDSVCLMLGTIEGFFRNGRSAKGFKWEIVITGKNHTVVIGYNKSKRRDALPVVVSDNNTCADYVPLEECSLISVRKAA